MKKYIIKRADGSEQDVMNAIHESRKEAGEALMDYICKHNRYLDTIGADDDEYLSPFDFTLEEVEYKEVNEVITDFESARKYLVSKSNDVFEVAEKRLSKSTDPIKDAEILIKEINPKHIKALVALNRLFTIAEAWNKADGFVPDFSDWNQIKWYPWFKYDKDTARFVYANNTWASADANGGSRLCMASADANVGSRLCFKTSERAAQFGKQFVDLYNKVFC